LGKIAYCKAAADPAGHYSRPDVTQLLLNKRPQSAVIYTGESNDGLSELEKNTDIDPNI